MTAKSDSGTKVRRNRPRLDVVTTTDKECLVNLPALAKHHIRVVQHGNGGMVRHLENPRVDSVGALQVLENMRFKFPRLAKIIADGGYRGKLLSDTLKATLGCELEVVLRPDECPSKFQVMPKRWIVERSFAWLENFRRLTIDYEFRAETAVAMIQLAFCFLMLNKIF